MGTYRSSEYPRWTASSSAGSCGGGGAFDHARQKRHSITHGSSQLLTRRKATGHDGEDPPVVPLRSPLLFSPASCGSGWFSVVGCASGAGSVNVSSCLRLYAHQQDEKAQKTISQCRLMARSLLTWKSEKPNSP